jgi:hypothetical protein
MVSSTAEQYDKPVPLGGNGPVTWHDGRLLHFGFSNQISDPNPSDFELYVELYPIFAFPHASNLQRFRYKILGKNALRFSVFGDVTLLKHNQSAGNIDYMRHDYTKTGEILNISLFGGYLNVEAQTFTICDTIASKIAAKQATARASH